MFASKTVVIAGYGSCGKGCALRAKGLGAKVIVTEISPLRALEAHSYGFDVMTLSEAVQKGELFITATGKSSAIKPDHLCKMNEGAIIANVGHSNEEIVLDDSMTKNFYKKDIHSIKTKSGKTIFLLADGHPVNLASTDATGNPIEVIDQTLALQFLAALDIAKNSASLNVGINKLPIEIDTEIVLIKLNALGINIDHEKPNQSFKSAA